MNTGRVTVTSWYEKEVDSRIEEYAKRGYKLKSRGKHQTYGRNVAIKHWAVLQKEELLSAKI